MHTAESHHEIREFNFAYLNLARRLARISVPVAMLRLGIGCEVAEILSKLSSAQVIELANSTSTLCRFRLDNHAVISSLMSEDSSVVATPLHATILLAQLAIESS